MIPEIILAAATGATLIFIVISLLLIFVIYSFVQKRKNIIKKIKSPNEKKEEKKQYMKRVINGEEISSTDKRNYEAIIEDQKRLVSMTYKGAFPWFACTNEFRKKLKMKNCKACKVMYERGNIPQTQREFHELHAKIWDELFYYKKTGENSSVVMDKLTEQPA